RQRHPHAERVERTLGFALILEEEHGAAGQADDDGDEQQDDDGFQHGDIRNYAELDGNKPDPWKHVMLARLQRFRFDWKLTLLTALLFLVLTSLGFWQLRREEEKLQLQSLYESRQAEPAVELALLEPDE